jgi:hypothetical protein
MMDAHSQKKKEIITKKEEKSHYSYLFLETTLLTPPRQHQEFSFSKSDTSKKGTMHKRRRHNIT